jgi:hypothetical protein
LLSSSLLTRKKTGRIANQSCFRPIGNLRRLIDYLGEEEEEEEGDM